VPLYDYEILDNEGNRTGQKFELLLKREKATDIIVSEDGTRAAKCLSIPARMNETWAGECGTLWGVNGRWNKGVGARVNSHREVERIAEAKGLVSLNDLPKDFVESRMGVMDERARSLDRMAESNSVQASNKQWSPT